MQRPEAMPLTVNKHAFSTVIQFPENPECFRNPIL